MIDYTNIESTLRKLDFEYSEQISDPQMPILFSKLAVIEFCGWIEESFDDVLYQYIDNHINGTNYQRLIRTSINKNHGFDYENQTFKLFSIVIGIKNWENILDRLPVLALTNFQTILRDYSQIRNRAAHTYTLIGTTRTFDTPSVVLSNFNKIKNPISIIETEIQSL
ncbi:hypothetical protein [Bacteroides ihuae]|uniref:hypothetical protein n=1 Tax=Bacteroides ihuae TaxID=1852362 RepID=UPI0008DA4226|nr:hypothetical protein [Bacteroides ihuae]